jgi:hypothetical protein
VWSQSERGMLLHTDGLLQTQDLRQIPDSLWLFCLTGFSLWRIPTPYSMKGRLPLLSNHQAVRSHCGSSTPFPSCGFSCSS